MRSRQCCTLLPLHDRTDTTAAVASGGACSRQAATPEQLAHNAAIWGGFQRASVQPICCPAVAHACLRTSQASPFPRPPTHPPRPPAALLCPPAAALLSLRTTSSPSPKAWASRRCRPTRKRGARHAAAVRPKGGGAESFSSAVRVKGPPCVPCLAAALAAAQECAKKLAACSRCGPAA